MFDRTRVIEQIRQRLKRILDTTPPIEKGLYSITLSAPEIHLRGLPAAQTGEPYWFWSQPNQEQYLFGCGHALQYNSESAMPIVELDEAFAALQQCWQTLDPDASNISPRAFVSFAFSADKPDSGIWKGFPAATICVPQLLVQQNSNRCHLTFTIDIDQEQAPPKPLNDWLKRLSVLLQGLNRLREPHSQRSKLQRIQEMPSRQAWIGLVEQAQKDIRNSSLEKVVLARHIRVQSCRELDPVRLLSTMDYLHPASRLFATGSAQYAFAAATPELLLSIRGQHIHCDAIGGTSARSADENKDRQLAQALRQNPKTRHEHRLIIDTIREAIAPLCQQITIPDTPDLIPLRGLQHLKTSIEGRLKTGISLLQAATHIHPTGAINGAPSADASRWLATHEDLQRGWYSGAAGWLDARGNGELAVLLRCALLKGEYADLYAGAGITEGSNPQDELAETELKFNSMLEALENA